MRHWLLDLSLIPRSHVVVFHKPMSIRYLTFANAAIETILRTCEVLGWADVSSGDAFKKFEVIVWTEPTNKGDFGWYAGFRITYETKTMEPQVATLFCFYNGKETGGDPKKGFKSKEKALTFMRRFYPQYIEISK